MGSVLLLLWLGVIVFILRIFYVLDQGGDDE